MDAIEAASMPGSSWCWQGSIELFARAQDIGLAGLPEAVYNEREADHKLSVLFALRQRPKVQLSDYVSIIFYFFIFYLDKYYIYILFIVHEKKNIQF
jgi:hypothetical protein